MISIALSIATLTMAPLTIQAHHASADAAPTIAVPYRDLDLSDPAGMKTLRSRIRAAADKLCPDSTRALAFDWISPGCRYAAIASARPQMLAAQERASQLAARDRGGEVAVLETRTGH